MWATFLLGLKNDEYEDGSVGVSDAVLTSEKSDLQVSDTDR